MACRDAQCTYDSHIRDTDHMFTQIIEMLQAAADQTVTKQKGATNKNKKHVVPGWNSYVSEAHGEARDAFGLWVLYGKPRHGPLS